MDKLEKRTVSPKSGSYRAPPVRRVLIPKGTRGQVRPIGVPAFEDKLAQRAVVLLLDAVYEQDFLDSSFGFKPGRSAHQGLYELWDTLMSMGGGRVIAIDIEDFFGSIDRPQLAAFLDKRVRDGVLRRLIGEWFKAGVLTERGIEKPDRGTPQGGVASPLPANVFLHEALDRWFDETVRPRLRGRAKLIRYPDDAALLFEGEDDARRVMPVIAKRFARAVWAPPTRSVWPVPDRAPNTRETADLQICGLVALISGMEVKAHGWVAPSYGGVEQRLELNAFEAAGALFQALVEALLSPQGWSLGLSQPEKFLHDEGQEQLRRMLKGYLELWSQDKVQVLVVGDDEVKRENRPSAHPKD